jgi:hypothetical protein
MQLVKLWELNKNIIKNTDICERKLHKKIINLNRNLVQNGNYLCTWEWKSTEQCNDWINKLQMWIRRNDDDNMEAMCYVYNCATQLTV